MSGLYSDDILGEIARANDIVEVVSGYFPLKRAGKDYQALCPFHAEKTPSFTVSPAKQIFKCFGCGRGGSVFNFVMARENATFPEAVRMLAERAGIELKDRAGAEKGAGARRQLRDVMEWATGLFEKGLKHPTAGAAGREYLESRAIAEATIQTFRIGFAPDGWDNLIRAAARDGMPLELLETGGLIIKRDDGAGYYDRFRGRVIFPILDALNRPIGFGGRALGDEQPKYLNSPETPLFHKSEALYGLPQARQAIEAERRAVVVEGYFDAVLPHQVGVKNVVATLGTALTSEHVRALRRYADEVVLIFDSDLAGQRAADRGMELFLAEDVRILIGVVPTGKDPCDFCRDYGAEEFRKVIAGTRDVFVVKWKGLSEEYATGKSPGAKQRALEAMFAVVAKMPRSQRTGPKMELHGMPAQMDLRIKASMIFQQMSEVTGLPHEVLLAEYKRYHRTAGRSAAGTEAGGLPDAAARGPRWAAERELMTVLVCRPSRLEKAIAAMPPDRIEDADFRRLYEALLANAARRDGDIESIVLGLEDAGLSSLAVQLFERGEALSACRNEADTGEGPLGRMFDESLGALQRLEEESRLAARSQAAKGNTESMLAYIGELQQRSRRKKGSKAI